jgi:hypothetical protein
VRIAAAQNNVAHDLPGGPDIGNADADRQRTRPVDTVEILGVLLFSIGLRCPGVSEKWLTTFALSRVMFPYVLFICAYEALIASTSPIKIRPGSFIKCFRSVLNCSFE